MNNVTKFYINGQWVTPVAARQISVINPATEGVAGQVSLGSSSDVDRAVRAARQALPAFAGLASSQRMELLQRILTAYEARKADLGVAIRTEMGAPRWLAEGLQVSAGQMHFQAAIDVLKTFKFSDDRGTTRIVREPIGVCGLITPWNWPLSLISAKVAPALAVGCTIVLKPSELAPFSAIIFAEILDAAGVPPGVFNLVHGDGATVGHAISSHAGIDMVSFTGSTRAGIEVARSAAATVKRVHQELGGKSPNIILDDADITTAVTNGVKSVFTNSGQTCNAPTRLLVPRPQLAEVVAIARKAAETFSVGDPAGDVLMGPVVSESQWLKIQSLIETAIKEGARLVTGGVGRPQGLERGYFVKPTIFSDVTNQMTIAREEVFGPVLPIMPYDDIDEAIAMANDTLYGLAAYVSGRNLDRVRHVASKLKAGSVNLNSAPRDPLAPFGGYKQSGNGREWGEFGFHEYLETKAVLGHGTLPQ